MDLVSLIDGVKFQILRSYYAVLVLVKQRKRTKLSSVLNIKNMEVSEVSKYQIYIEVSNLLLFQLAKFEISSDIQEILFKVNLREKMIFLMHRQSAIFNQSIFPGFFIQYF